MTSLIHTIFSVIALITGGVIFFNVKGTTLHKRLGYLYNMSMVGLIITSFSIIELFDGFGVYHALSLISLITLMIGMSFPLLGRERFTHWYIHHYIWMSYSYVGLLMAGGSHLFQVFPNWPAALRIGLFWGLPYIAGSIMIFSNRRRLQLTLESKFRGGQKPTK